MSQKKPVLTRAVVTPDTAATFKIGCIIAGAFIAIVCFTIILITVLPSDHTAEMRKIRQSVLNEAVWSGELGMIRPSERWTDHDRVSYRWPAADTVIVADPPLREDPSTALRAGDRCFVHGSTSVQFMAVLDNDVLVRVGVQYGRTFNEPDDCPVGTRFVVNLDEAGRMLWNARQYLWREAHDRTLLRLAE